MTLRKGFKLHAVPLPEKTIKWLRRESKLSRAPQGLIIDEALERYALIWGRWKKSVRLGRR